MRHLLFLSYSASDRLRMRHIEANSPQDDFDAVMQYHNSMQEKVAQEMMSLVQNLKQNSLLAGHIIRKDTDVSFFCFSNNIVWFVCFYLFNLISIDLCLVTKEFPTNINSV